MRKVYFDIVCRMAGSLYSALYGAEALIGLGIWLAGAYSERFSAWIEQNTGLDDRWLLVPLGLVVLHLFFKALHERSEQWKRDLIEQCKQLAQSSQSSEIDHEKMRRLEEVRELLKKQADDAPPDTRCEQSAVNQNWLRDTNEMLGQLLNPSIRTMLNQHPSWVNNYSHFMQSVVSLRTIAANLRIEDLRSD